MCDVSNFCSLEWCCYVVVTLKLLVIEWESMVAFTVCWFLR